MNVMTYNIRFDNPDDQNDSWDRRKDLILEQLLFYEPAVFGIQEGMHHQVQYLDDSLPGYEYVGVGRDDGRTGGEYSAVYYNHRLFTRVKDHTFWLSETPGEPSVGWDAAMERICTCVLLRDKKSGKQLWVFNTHFDHVGEKARRNSARLILDKINELNVDNHPVVLMGDLNAQPDDQPIQRIGSRMQDTRMISQTRPFGPEGTYNGFRFDEPVKRRIDYVFVDGLKVLKYGVLSDPENLQYPSDHFPVMARVKF
jgi:endonuclease/exonuclease/phosphatase family metal-dependent hydrolase